MPTIGPMELVIVLAIALLILGPKKLPAAGRSLGEGLRGFKETLSSAKPEPDEPALTAEQRASTPAGRD